MQQQQKDNKDSTCLLSLTVRQSTGEEHLLLGTYVYVYVYIYIFIHTKSRIHSLNHAYTHTNKNYRGLHATTLLPPSTSSSSSTKTRRTAAAAGGGGGGGQAAPAGKGKGEAANTHTGNQVTVEDFAAQLEPFGVTGIRFCEGA